MKTTHEHGKNEATKRLFRELFEMQYKLECDKDHYNLDVQMAIAMIDDILETILCSLDD